MEFLAWVSDGRPDLDFYLDTYFNAYSDSEEAAAAGLISETAAEELQWLYSNPPSECYRAMWEAQEAYLLSLTKLGDAEYARYMYGEYDAVFAVFDEMEAALDAVERSLQAETCS